MLALYPANRRLSPPIVFNDPRALAQRNPCVWPTLARSPIGRPRNNVLGLGVRASPRSLAAADHEEELPEMPSVTHPFPTAAGRRRRPCELLRGADHQPLRSHPNFVVAGFGTV